MFDNIGGKIKTLSRVTCWIGIIASIIIGFILMAKNDEFILIGVLIMILGCLASWIGSFMTYGFGELIDKACNIEQTICGSKKSSTQVSIDYERISKIEKLRSQGLITEEEYQQAILKDK